MPFGPRQLVERGHRGQPLVGELAGAALAHGGEPGPLRVRLAGPVLPAEEAAGQGKKGRNAVPVRSHHSRTPSSGSRWRMLYWFCTLTKPGLPGRRGRCRLVEQVGAEVGAADLADLALGHQLAQRAERFGDRGLRVGQVQLVEVDVVGAEPGQAVLDGRAGRRPATAPPSWPS